MSDVDRWHRERGFHGCGYHYLVTLDGTIEQGRPIDEIGAHCKGHNATSVGIAYVGGLDKDGKPADTRTKAQKKALSRLIWQLSLRAMLNGWGLVKVRGHHDYDNGKECPCFDARAEYD